MKRHDALHPLSHEHQNALARALRLRRAATLDADGRRSGTEAFLEFARARIEPHFAAEEALLVRASTAAGATSAITAAERRLGQEHELLRAGFDQLGIELEAHDAPEASLMLSVGQQLTDHIRFEERELFELLQDTLDDDALRAVAAPLEGRGA